MRRVHVIDFHTGFDPTRLMLSGGPDPGNTSMAERLVRFRSEHGLFRSAVVNEPRGSNAVVGALLCELVDPACVAGAIFFHNVGYLGMCGHGAIGAGATPAWMGRITAGCHLVETPVGTAGIELHADGKVSVDHVESYRAAHNATIAVEGIGAVHDCSPCGTGTSAKLACLIADGKPGADDTCRQESIIDTVLEASAKVRDGRIYPRLKGSAFIGADVRLVFQENGPFVWGIRQ
jgi:proline racemase